MPDLTPKLGIQKPLGNETVTRAGWNANWDIIDAAAQKEIAKSTSSPASPKTDDLWIDTSITPHTLKRYTGSVWRDVGIPATSIQNAIDNARKDSTKEFVLEVRTSDPASPAIGRMWLRSDL
ncbi:hypothetical protein N0M98_25035 [Paenibacillus doosanensis]|uniref:Uncharacterized protein n=1 Tax=Paenibacillus konkukensis TaxID=2020716 RepID=A0ABY4RNL9_9BACL|nr:MULTISPECIES: hypothetical protein [Paenibacillus]MCS7463374.1 hypothetical protein [Paenibacillus doosanensis]UQZ84027.1 hypothetical protein SK3146_03239 [Paenibacillus konkukensis]